MIDKGLLVTAALFMLLLVPYICGAAVVGTVGNLLIVGSIILLSTRQHHNVANAFVFNLAITDLIVAVINPFRIIGVWPELLSPELT